MKYNNTVYLLSQVQVCSDFKVNFLLHPPSTVPIHPVKTSNTTQPPPPLHPTPYPNTTPKTTTEIFLGSRLARWQPDISSANHNFPHSRLQPGKCKSWNRVNINPSLFKIAKLLKVLFLSLQYKGWIRTFHFHFLIIKPIDSF